MINQITNIINKNHTPLKQRLAYSMIWSLFGSIFSRSIIMVANIGLGRILGANNLGQLGIIQNTISVFYVIASSGISQAVTKYVAESRFKDPEEIKKYLQTGVIFSGILGIIGVIIIIGFSNTISSNLSEEINIASQLGLFSFTILFVSINNVLIAALAGLEQFKKIAYINGLRSVFYLTFGIIGGKILFLNGALIGLAFAELIAVIASYSFLRTSLPNKCMSFTTIDIKIVSRILKFFTPSMIGSIVTMSSIWFCNYLLTKNAGFAAMGIFNAADKWKQIVIFAPTAMAPVILPLLANSATNGRQFKEIYRLNFWINMTIITIPSLFIIFFSGPAMGLFGKEFIAGANVLVLLTLSSIFSVLNNILGQTMISLGAVNARLIFDVILSVILVGLSLTAIPKIGIQGLALSYLVTYFSTSLMVFIFTNKLLKQKGLI